MSVTEKKMISQKEYLKKYLSSGKDRKKKVKKKKPNVGSKTVTIIDDDIDLNSMRPIEVGEFDIFNNTEDGPQIAGIVDERGPVDFSDKKRWKIITDDGYGDVSVTSVPRNERIVEDSGQERVAPSEPVKSHLNSRDSDCSPPRRPRKDSDSDESGKRNSSSKKRRRRGSTPIQNASVSQDSDFSPPRRARKDSDSDLSPPRNRKSHKSKSKRSKERENPSRSSRHDKGDIRSARRAHSFVSSSNEGDSSRSRRRSDSHKVNGRSGRRNSPEYDRSDQSSRKNGAKLTNSRKNGADKNAALSPGRRRNNGEKSTHKSSRKDNSSESDLSPPREVRKNHEYLNTDSGPVEKKTKNYQMMTAETSGYGKAPILRDRKTGRRRDLAAEARDQAEKDEKRQELEEKYAQWGKGLKQVEDRQQKLDRDLYEMSKPLARYVDDADLERELKAQEREGDPMLAYMKRKQVKEGKREPEKPKYSGPFMPNRFGIRPGYRWDGVDRSNGYEKKWFDAQNARKAIQEEAYKWSTADM